MFYFYHHCTNTTNRLTRVLFIIAEEEFGQLCFDFGIELDDITSEYEEIKAEKGENAPELATASKAVLYKIELPGIVNTQKFLQKFLDKQHNTLGQTWIHL